MEKSASLKKNRKNSKGMTLIEILMVITLVGILAALAVPNIMRSRDQALDYQKVQNADTLNTMAIAMHNDGVDLTGYASAADFIVAVRAGITVPSEVTNGTDKQYRLEKDLNGAAYTMVAGTAQTPPRFTANLGNRNVKP